MNILAIDYGKKRIGLAWCQRELGIILPYGVVNTIEEVIELIKREKIDKIVIGLPLGLNSQENENSQRVRLWASQLEKETTRVVEWVDERFSSHEAGHSPGTVSRDERSAMIILETYLEKNK